MVGNDPHITVLDLSGEIFQPPRPQIMHTILQPLVASLVHHSLQKRGLVTVDPELCGRNSLAYSRERIDGEIHTVSLN
jgi:hypothetical protein